ncbi:hypothetical protein COOONC_17188, partial [Cooperia oncophora]
MSIDTLNMDICAIHLVFCPPDSPETKICRPGRCKAWLDWAVSSVVTSSQETVWIGAEQYRRLHPQNYYPSRSPSYTRSERSLDGVCPFSFFFLTFCHVFFQSFTI